MINRGARYRWAAGGGIAAILIASRLFLAPKYLYHFDSVNFALALTDFDPLEHQPQPPGYPLFVLLARVIYRAVSSPQMALVLTGILGSLAGMFLVWRVGRDMFGDRAGLCAALLLLFHPAFWFSGLTNQVRVFLVAGTAATMLAVWRSLSRDRAGPYWFYLAAASAGFFAGFRPMEMLFLVPLIVWSGVRVRRPALQWLTAAGIFALSVLSWLSMLFIAVNGPARYLALVRQYADIQFGPTSLAWGAAAEPAMGMLTAALVWYTVPLLSWIWAAPFVWRRLDQLKEAGGLLALVFVPAFLFHAFIHVGDPDHTLIGVPALCVLGGFVLSRLDRARAAAATAAVAMSVLLFFSPPAGIASKCSYSAVQEIDLVTRSTFQAIERIGRAQPLVLVALDHPVSWRHLLFYFPENPVIILHGDPASANPQRPWIIRHRKRRELEPEADRIPLPAGVKVVWLLARGRGLERLLGTEGPIGTQGDLLYSEPPDGLKFRFGSYLFTVVRTPEILKEASYIPTGE